MCGIERDAFTPAAGYPPGTEIDGMPLRDRVWLEDVAGLVERGERARDVVEVPAQPVRLERGRHLGEHIAQTVELEGQRGRLRAAMTPRDDLA